MAVRSTISPRNLRSKAKISTILSNNIFYISYLYRSDPLIPPLSPIPEDAP